MAESVTITTRMSAEKKHQGAEVFSALGTSSSQVIGQLYDYAIKHKALPFDNSEERQADIQRKLKLAKSIPLSHSIALTNDEIREARLKDRHAAID